DGLVSHPGAGGPCRQARSAGPHQRKAVMVRSEPPGSAPGPLRLLGGPLRDAWDLFVAPAALFERLPGQSRGLAYLVALLVLKALLAYGVVSTGVSDYEVTLRARHQLSADRLPEGEDDPAAAVRGAEWSDRQEEFDRLLARLSLIGG